MKVSEKVKSSRPQSSVFSDPVLEKMHEKIVAFDPNRWVGHRFPIFVILVLDSAELEHQ